MKRAKTTWVVQSNLGSDDAFDRLYRANEDRNEFWIPAKAIPFDTAPLKFKNLDLDGPLVIYGATGFVGRAFKQHELKRGVFFDPETFRYEAYLDGYGRSFINMDAQIYTVEELGQVALKMPGGIRGFGDHVFVRPVLDSKQFAGEVIELKKFARWCRSVSAGNDQFEGCLVAVARPKDLAHEWRMFMVDGHVVASSLYRYHGRLLPAAKQEAASKSVHAFAEAMHKLWNPGVEVYVMDIAQDETGYGVLEVNCFNSCGFYGADIDSVFKQVTDCAVNRVAKKQKEKADGETV